MKNLIFVRHGKAEDHGHMISDFERSLTTKGKTISRTMALALKEREPEPGIFISSPAFRALETAIIFAESFGVEPDKVILNSKLYYNMSYQILPEILQLVPEECNSVILFGHNPAFTEIPDILCTEGSGFMSKSAIVGITFNSKTWSGIKRNSGKIKYFLKH